MTNYGDVISWFTVLKVMLVTVPLIVAGSLMLRQSMYTKEMVNKRKQDVIVICICLSLSALMILGAFVFYGKGNTVHAAPADTDGHSQKLMAQPDPPAESIIDLKAEAKKNAYLKRMDEGPAKDREESEAYLKKLINRNTNK